MKRAIYLGAALLAVLLLAGSALAQVRQPPVRTTSAATGILFKQTALEDETAYSAIVPVVTGVSGETDVVRIGFVTVADLLTSATVGESATLTVTPQFSADGENWADAYGTHLGTTGIEERTLQTVLTADGAELLRVAVVGQYMRVKVTAEGEVTPEIRVTLRN